MCVCERAQGSERNYQPSEARAPDGCELCDVKLGPLQEQHVLFTAEPFLQSRRKRS